MKLITHNQGSPEWKAWRSGAWLHGKRFGGGIGGSDVSAILGLSPYTDPPHTRETVFAEKVHGVERESNFAMHRGQRLEPHARAAYQARARCIAPPACVENDRFEWARVSLDCRPDPFARTEGMPAAARERALRAAIAGSTGEAERWLLELKCPNWETHDSALQGVVAEHFEVQVQWQMYVTGIQRLDFASFNPGARFTPAGFPPFDEWLKLDPKCRPPAPAEWLSVHAVAPDRDRQEWILEHAARFWLEVDDARQALPAKGCSKVEAEFA